MIFSVEKQNGKKALLSNKLSWQSTRLFPNSFPLHLLMLLCIYLCSYVMILLSWKKTCQDGNDASFLNRLFLPTTFLIMLRLKKYYRSKAKQMWKPENWVQWKLPYWYWVAVALSSELPGPLATYTGLPKIKPVKVLALIWKVLFRPHSLIISCW